ncbi:MAG: hypothetical protein Q7T78_01550 [Rhodoferax sp.]|nr:hypothetical protein [Rhodoferax sp.]
MSLADLMKKGSLRQFATVTVATVATVRPDHLPSVASVASVASVSVATTQKQAANDPAAVTHDPDRWAWPHSQAMTGREIDTFTARLHHFTRRGLAEPDAERLADKLVTRDREADDRRLCLECVHLAGRADVWGCRNWQRAGIASMARQAQLSAALVNQPQRCDGFTDQNQQGTAT